MGGQGGCEGRSEAFVKIQKKKKIFLGGGVGGLGQGGGVGLGGGGQAGWMGTEKLSLCENSKKKNWGGGRSGGGEGFGLGGQVGCEWRSEAFVKIQKIFFFFFFFFLGGGGVGGGSGWMGTEN